MVRKVDLAARRRRLRVGLVVDGFVGRSAAGGVQLANGGVGVYIEHLARALVALDRVDLTLIRPGPLDLALLRDPALPTVSHPILRRLPRARWLDLGLASIARRHRLDLIHYPNQLGGAFLARHVPRVITLHDLTPLTLPGTHPPWSVAGYRLLLRQTLRRAGAVIVDSQFVRDELLRIAPWIASRLTVVPLAAADRFRPRSRTPAFRERLGIPERFLLAVGVLEPRKNHVAAVHALARLHAAGESIGLVIAGRTGWRWQDPVAATRQLQVRPWVRILENVPDEELVELYGRAEALVYPSLSEGFGLPILEAMACGCPVVASDRSALPEVGGDAALYAPPDDPDAIARQLLVLLRDPAVRRGCVERGRARARAYSWRRTAEQTAEVYASVLR
ncbi:MAG TPA: glycosyltransferase family 1 protein [Candidatus Bathyarchaeia archaeon]|nr:glycosyltransferase family 1 protein [Candidatus Bathyarchaeia archaeon]